MTCITVHVWANSENVDFSPTLQLFMPLISVDLHLQEMSRITTELIIAAAQSFHEVVQGI